MVSDVTFDMLRQREKSNKKSKNGGAKESVPYLKESIHFGLCVSRLSSEKVCSTERRKSDIYYAVRFPKSTWHHVKVHEREDPSRGSVHKC